MKKRAVQTPCEVVDRGIGYLEGAPRYETLRRMGVLMILARRAVTSIFRVPHFESIEELKEHEGHLEQGSYVAFQNPLKVAGVADAHSRTTLRLQDGSGEMVLHHPYNASNDAETMPDRSNDSIHGAIPGDQIDLFLAQYQRAGVIMVPHGILIDAKNDAHWKRVCDERERMTEALRGGKTITF